MTQRTGPMSLLKNEMAQRVSSSPRHLYSKPNRNENMLQVNIHKPSRSSFSGTCCIISNPFNIVNPTRNNYPMLKSSSTFRSAPLPSRVTIAVEKKRHEIEGLTSSSARRRGGWLSGVGTYRWRACGLEGEASQISSGPCRSAGKLTGRR